MAVNEGSQGWSLLFRGGTIVGNTEGQSLAIGGLKSLLRFFRNQGGFVNNLFKISKQNMIFEPQNGIKIH